MKSVSSVEEYILKSEKWQDALLLLCELIESTGLKETIKWGSPVYTFEGKNVVGLGAFKKHLALWFFNGVFLSDPKKLLINAQEGTTTALRQMRFSSIDEIDSNAVKKYVLEAIENQKAGKIFKYSAVKKVVIPEELKLAFNEDPEIIKQFKKFTPAKQYQFTHYIASAKREDTRLRRTDKCVPLILKGEGLYDIYK